MIEPAPATAVGRAPDGAATLTGPGVLSRAHRVAALQALDAAEPFDVVVIGGGVTGAGCALDAATRGLSVVLVEASDLAAGTSSRSGKTFHGGLRYLEQLNFSLVHHAIVERDLMVNVVAPYISRPSPFLYPLTKHWERPYAGVGIALYDVFGLRGRAVPRHRHFSRRGSIRHAPSLDGAVVTGGIQYYDVLMDDARHTMAVARTAAANGAVVISRAPVVDFLRDGDRIDGVTISDVATGQQHRIRAKVVINAAGVWSAELQQLAGAHTFDVAPAKGVHLLVRGDAIDSDTGILARATDSIIIARRWLDHWLVGTTDTPWDGDKGAPVADAADVRYLLRELNRFLVRKITPDDVLGVFAGVRPLLKPVTRSGDDDDVTSALSRDHSIIPGPAGLVTVVGGKYTTYRLMAADTVNAAVLDAGLAAPESVTDRTPLIGAAGYAALVNRVPALARRYGLPVAQIERLMFRYGTLLEQVLTVSGSSGPADRAAPDRPVPDRVWITPRADWAGYLPAELLYAVRAEGAMTLRDVLERRTHIAIESPDGGTGAAPEIAALLAGELGWDADRIRHEVDDYRAAVAADRAALEQVRAELAAAIDDGRPGDERSGAGDQAASTPVGVIFDMDGIVADTEHLWDIAWASFARSYGVKWTHADSMRLQGMSVPEWAAQLASDSGVPDRADQAAASCVDYIVTAVAGGDGQLMKGAAELISYAARRVPIALASSSDRRIIDALLVARGVDHWFSATVSSAEVARGKPSPDVYLEAAERIGVAGKPAVGIEDSGSGIRAAHAAGLYTIAIPNRQFPPGPEALALADYVAVDHADALAHLKSLLPQAPLPVPDDRR